MLEVVGGSFSKTREVGYERASAKGDKFRYLPWLHIHNEIIGQRRPRAKSHRYSDVTMADGAYRCVFLLLLISCASSTGLNICLKSKGGESFFFGGGGGSGGQLHKYVCKKVLSVSQKMPNSMSYGELRRHTLYRQ